MRTAIGIALSLFLTLSGCSGEPDAASDNSAAPGHDAASQQDMPEPGPRDGVADAHSSRNALDWAGTYSGVLPCASCTGIETTVTLNADGSYQRSLLYIDEQPIPQVSTGTFSWDLAGRGVTLEADADEAQQYQVGENMLFHLDRDGQRIDGDLAARYELHKHMNDPRIEDRRWALVELRGQPVQAPTNGNAPFMILDGAESRVSGNASCNSFNGPYAIKSGNRIAPGKNMAMTMMACPDMNLEAQFLEMLAMADNYSIGNDGMLSLNRARMAPLARFVEVEESE